MTSESRVFRAEPETSQLWVGDRAWPAEIGGQDLDTDDSYPPFRTRWATVWFENGWQVSIVWGSGAFGTNRLDLGDPHWTETPETVEVAIIGKEHGMITTKNGCGYITGWRTVDHVDSILSAVAKWDSDEDVERDVPGWWDE